MTLEVPNWLQGGTYPARLDRGLIAELYDEGVLDGLKVRQRGAGANLTVDVDLGRAIVTGDDQADQGNYRCASTATENVTGFVATSSTQRIDLVVLRVNDPNAGGPAGNNFTIVRVAGAESGSPVAPALPTSAIALAQVGPFTTGTVSITDAMITDLRTSAGPRSFPGDIRPKASTRSVMGWLTCDGSVKSRTTYPRLFDAIGTLYNVGGESGSDFRLPNLNGRIPWPLSNVNTAIDTIGEQGGEYTHALTTAELAAHTHPIDHDHASFNTANTYYRADAGLGGFRTDLQNEQYQEQVIPIDIPPFTGTSGSAGSGTGHQNMPPYQVVAGYIIRT